MQDELALIAQNDILRVAINTGNRALVQNDGGKLTGVSPALAQRLADRLGVTFEPVMYTGAGKVFADASSDRWDVAFLAIDETRALQISFTRPYHVIEATYAVRSNAPFQRVSDADRRGVTILTATGSAYDMYLSKTLKTRT
jgi:polar amino acid transport system substrate-binding protein